MLEKEASDPWKVSEFDSRQTGGFIIMGEYPFASVFIFTTWPSRVRKVGLKRKARINLFASSIFVGLDPDFTAH
jgi:hypothetical protein